MLTNLLFITAVASTLAALTAAFGPAAPQGAPVRIRFGSPDKRHSKG